MARRALTNTALWALEDAYAALLHIERDLAPLVDDPQQPTRSSLIATISQARVTAANARLVITEVHPKVRDKVSTR